MTTRMTRLISLFILLLSSTFAFAQSTPPNLNGFDGVVEQVMKEWKVPGLAVAIVKDGKVVYAQGYGYRDVKRQWKVTPDTLFAIGSLSKAFTTTAMGILVDEKKLDWDQPVRTYAPDWKLYDDYATAHIRPRDLISHQSGLPRHDQVWLSSPLPRKELFARLRYLEPNAPVHTKYQYNNLMFVAAGGVIERVTGGTWEEFVRRRILDPLGMKSTNFSVSDSQKSQNYSLPYNVVNGEAQEVPFLNIDAIGPAGSINSNVNEMANWLLLQLNKGKFNDAQIVSEKSLLETHTPQIVAPVPMYDETSHNKYAMGWNVDVYRGQPRLRHTGSIRGFTSSLQLLPKQKIGVIVLTNFPTHNPDVIITTNVLDRMLGLSQVPWNQRFKEENLKALADSTKAKAETEAKRKKDTQPLLALQSYTGQFEHPAYQTITITQDGEQLKGDLHGQPFALKHYHYDIFQIPEGGMSGRSASYLVKFLMNDTGAIDRVAIRLEPATNEIVFTRKKEPNVAAPSGK